MAFRALGVACSLAILVGLSMVHAQPNDSDVVWQGDERPARVEKLRDRASADEMYAYLKKNVFDATGKTMPPRFSGGWWNAWRPGDCVAPHHVTAILRGEGGPAKLYADLSAELERAQAPELESLRSELRMQLQWLEEAARVAMPVIERFRAMAQPGLEKQCPDFDPTDMSVPTWKRRSLACMAVAAMDNINTWTPYHMDNTRQALTVVFHAWLEAWPEWKREWATGPRLRIDHLQKTVERIHKAFNANQVPTQDYRLAIDSLGNFVHGTILNILGDDEFFELVNEVARTLLSEDGARSQAAMPTVTATREPINDVIREQVKAQALPVSFETKRTVDATLFMVPPVGPACTASANMSIGDPHWFVVAVDVECSTSAWHAVRPLPPNTGFIGKMSLFLDSDKYAEDKGDGDDGARATKEASRVFPVACSGNASLPTVRCWRIWGSGVDTDVVRLDQLIEHNTGMLTLFAFPVGDDGVIDDSHEPLSAQTVVHFTWEDNTGGKDVNATVTTGQSSSSPNAIVEEVGSSRGIPAGMMDHATRVAQAESRKHTEL